MKIHDITDFRETGIYKHVKATEPQNNMPPEQLVRYIYNKYYTKESLFLTIKDSHIFPSNSDGEIHIPLGGAARYDGIYDIWLRNCVGITSITLCFGDLEVPIPEFKLNNDICIQIPLAFMTEGKEVSNVFAYATSELGLKNTCSFIPSVAIQVDKMIIKLNNTGPSCDAHISTIYYNSLSWRRRLVHSQNTFYIAGEPFVTINGQVQKPDNAKQSGCIIC